MAKDIKEKKENIKVQGVSKRGRKILLIGIVGYVLAFIILSMVDSEATNWASVVSPLLFVSSFITIALGIIAKDKGAVK